MKTVIALATLVAFALINGSIAAENLPTMPPGVDKLDWIPISDGFGMVTQPTGPYSDARKPTLSGILMVRRGTTWYHVDLAPAQFTRVH